ncbi:outer membrane lipoprotein-sorting protein [Desulfoluna spongiiphila]|uniref:outer membrane lipoprotein-sorting protein n=1 Tax=Desulfoluna spongiiphila TaxID=419481 RepID=UPI0012520FA6|nr:outer membrane lipoprotein-sorting protein [Desulfoluna spongiiphila]VVS94933.1 putative outer membrane lipoprotein-sorting protein [Desulfoluna spongiiphila]
MKTVQKVMVYAVAGVMIHTGVFALTGREVVDRSEEIASPDTATSEVVMEIQKKGKVTEKTFTLTAMDDESGEDRALIAFHKPSRIKLLTHTHKAKDDDQWLQMSSGRVKRISQSSKKKAFVNSHFTYEDISSRDVDDYAYTLLGKETVAGEPCYKVESVRTRGKKVYDKTVLYISEKDWFLRKMDYYSKGKLLKFLENKDIRTVDGILTPYEVVMSRAPEGGQTRLLLQEIRYNLPMKPTDFRKESLR